MHRIGIGANQALMEESGGGNNYLYDEDLEEEDEESEEQERLSRVSVLLLIRSYCLQP